MLRSFFSGLSHLTWAQQAITRWGLARRTAFRFVAGETPEAAIQAIQQLNEQGIQATLDHLGENTLSPEAACQAANEVIAMFDTIDRAHVRANISLKLSQMGLAIDPQLCRDNLQCILEKASALGNFVRIDMEDSSLTGPTLDQYFWARQQGWENLGVVIQAYLYRSEADIQRLASLQGKVRLCKGAYDEPPDLAFPLKKSVDENFDHLAEMLLEAAQQAGLPRLSADGKTPPLPGFATHDEQRINQIRATVIRKHFPKDGLEFQMLYGIRHDLQVELVKAGFPVRVYVPFGSQWYPYFMRRLAERPANVWFFVSNFFRR